MKKLLKEYFYWTYARGRIHYDVMVTLILGFIFITPHLWNYGDKPSSAGDLTQPIQVVGNDGKGLIITVQAANVDLAAGSSDAEAKRALRKAIEPITGDAVFVEHWELRRDASGNPVEWKIWAHR